MCDRKLCLDDDTRSLDGGSSSGSSILSVTPTQKKTAAIHATPETLAKVRRRIKAEGLKVLGVRFEGDVLFCRAARFETLRRELGEGFEGIELPSSSAAPHLGFLIRAAALIQIQEDLIIEIVAYLYN